MADNAGEIINRCCIPKDRVHRVAIICGDAKRFELFKQAGTKYAEFGQYLCWKAAEFEKDGEMFLVACHGVGALPCITLIRELINLGVKCIIRSGTCGTFLPRQYVIGDICIVYAGVRGESSSLNEISAPFPAVADPDVVEALREGSEKHNVATHLGITYTTDHFYRNYFTRGDVRGSYIKAGVAIEDTESAALFVLGGLYNVKVGAICTIDGCPMEWIIGNYGTNTEQMHRGKCAMIKVTLEAAVKMSRMIKAEEAA